MADAPKAPALVRKIGVTEMPKSGGNGEKLRVHGLSAGGIAERVPATLTVPL